MWWHQQLISVNFMRSEYAACLMNGDTVLSNSFSVYHPSGCEMKYEKTILLHMTFIHLNDIYLKVHPRNCVYLFLFTQKVNLCKLQWIYLKTRSNRSPVIFRSQPDAGVLNQTSLNETKPIACKHFMVFVFFPNCESFCQLQSSRSWRGETGWSTSTTSAKTMTPAR